MSNADMRLTVSLYLAVLRKDLPNPLAKESDEEKPKDEKKEAEKPAAKPGAPAKPRKPAKGPEPVRIDFDGLDTRIVAVPIAAGVYGNLQAGENGKLFYRKNDPPPSPVTGGQGESSIRVFDLVPARTRPSASRRTASADRRPQEDAGRLAGRLEHHRRGRQARARQGQAEHGRHRGPRRPRGRVAADLRRGLAHQPRLLLRSPFTAPIGRP